MSNFEALIFIKIEFITIQSQNLHCNNWTKQSTIGHSAYSDYLKTISLQYYFLVWFSEFWWWGLYIGSILYTSRFRFWASIKVQSFWFKNYRIVNKQLLFAQTGFHRYSLHLKVSRISNFFSNFRRKIHHHKTQVLLNKAQKVPSRRPSYLFHGWVLL